jgi:hypothetical protein
MSDGNFFRTLFAWVLRVEAGLTVIGIFYGSVKLWGLVRGEHAPASLYLGLLIVQLALLVLAIIIVNILLIRAEDIEKLPLGTDYIVTPIFVLFEKTAGEIGAAVYSVLGIAAGLFIWISGFAIPLPIPGLSGGEGFIAGLLTMIVGVIIGLVVLLLAYLTAELTGALVDIARNTKK